MNKSKVLAGLMLAALLAACLPAVCRAQQEQAPAAAGGAAAAAEAAPAASGGEQAAKVETSVKISMDDLKKLLDRKETPRVQLTTKYSTLTGTAVRIEKGMVFVDVTGERVAVAGVLGLPVGDVREIKVLKALSAQERNALEAASKAYLAKLAAAEKSAEATAAEQEMAEVEQPEAAAEGGEASEAQGGQAGQKQETDLLKMYPPEEGWGPDKVAEITRKRIVLGLEPFGKDESFLRDYDAWKKAYELKRNQQLEIEAAYKAAGQPIPEGFTVLPELTPVPTMSGEPWAGEKPE